MNMKTSISILIVVIIVVGGYFLFSNGENGESIEESKEETTEETSAFEFPEVYSEVNWGNPTNVTKDAAGYTDSEGNFRIASFKGTERSASIETDEIEDYPRMLLALTEYYNNALGEGWSGTEIDIDGLGLSPLVGDGWRHSWGWPAHLS